MLRSKVFAPIPFIAVIAALSACAPSVSISDLSKPSFGLNSNPGVLLDPPYVQGNQQILLNPQTPCLISNYRCSPQAQLQSAEGVLR